MLRVLIAEDDPVSLRLLETVLKREGYSVTSAADGTQALALFTVDRYQIVISDWMMPGMDGLELCRRIRSANSDDYVYFILQTAKAGKSNYHEGMEAGADDYLTKPLDLDELKIRLKVAHRILSLHSDVKALEAILPVCAWCKKVRQDQALWQTAEAYIASHMHVNLSHSICPDCLEKQKLNGGARR
jgi:sigma-B regulation protein RsbU (phosphoserine phosphatase)